MRKPNQEDARLLLKLYELRREPELRKARAWYLSQFVPTRWEKLKASFGTGTDEDRYLRMVTTYWDMVAALVNNGALHEELFFQTNGEDIYVWQRSEQWVIGRRLEMRAPFYLWNLETLARRHLAYRERWTRALALPSSRSAARSSGRKA